MAVIGLALLAVARRVVRYRPPERRKRGSVAVPPAKAAILEPAE
jgi:hypothetical protein